MKNEKENNKTIKKLVIVILLLCIAIFALKTAPSFIQNEITDRTNLVINYNNVTAKMKGIVYKDNNGIYYLSKEDIKNYYDGNIYYDKQYNQIITTSDTKIATMPINSKRITINGEYKNLKASVIEKDGTYYLPISEMQDIYSINLKYIEKTDTIVIESLDKELKIGIIGKKVSVKYQSTYLSKTVDKVAEGDKVTIIPVDANLNGWVKIRTSSGKIGYIEKTKIKDEKIERQAKINEKQIEGKISLVWEYFSEFAKAPNRTGTKYNGVNVVSPSFLYMENGELKTNIGTQGEQYISWAKQNGYKVWSIVANNSNSTEKKQAFSKIVNDYKQRESLINSIIEYAVEYNLDGINLDCENMYQKDKEMYSRLVIELAPRLKELGIVLSVDVTAPDGSADWSLCYDRNVIGEVADYIVFMAYDQYGVSSKKAGTTAGFNWVENSLNKFINQEEVDSSKIILGIPFYTRLWKEKSGAVTSGVVSMKNLDKVIPNDVQTSWDDECKQNYAEFDKDGSHCKIWIEDEKSITHKLGLIDTYNLAGAGFWVKGFEVDSIWNVIQTKLNIK